MSLVQRPENDFGIDDEEEEITPEYLNSLLDAARSRLPSASTSTAPASTSSLHDADVLVLDAEPEKPVLELALNPGPLPSPPPIPTPRRKDKGKAVEKGTETKESGVPAPPADPNPKTKKPKTSWHALPTPSSPDDIKKQIDALNLHNSIDPKRFYRKEAMGVSSSKAVIGTFLPTPFDPPNTSSKKRSLVEDLVADSEMNRYAKKKFQDLQTQNGRKGKDTKKGRKPYTKW